MAALGGSAALNLFPSGPRWWLGLAAVTGLLILSVVGEYYVIDRKDARYDLAAVGLNILGLTLLAIVLSALHADQARLAFALPVDCGSGRGDRGAAAGSCGRARSGDQIFLGGDRFAGFGTGAPPFLSSRFLR